MREEEVPKREIAYGYKLESINIQPLWHKDWDQDNIILRLRPLFAANFQVKNEVFFE